MDSAFGDCGLPPITEQTDMEQMDSGNSMVEFEQFLPLDSDFSERAAMSALGVAKSENVGTNSIPDLVKLFRRGLRNLNLQVFT